MTTKFDKVMQNLQDSLDTSIDIEGVEWCHVKRCELLALIDSALIVKGFASYPHQDSCQSIIHALESCADE